MLRPLEIRVLQAYCARPGRETLAAQIPFLEYVERGESNIAFWADFRVRDGAPREDPPDDYCLASLFGFSPEMEHGISFVVDVTAGTISSLEGVTLAHEPWPKNEEGITLRFEEVGGLAEQPGPT